MSPACGTPSTGTNSSHSMCPTTAARIPPCSQIVGRARLTTMMQAMAIPPFERFYEEHRSDVLRLLRRRLGADRAEDAFQETFLRALRAYGRLDHGEHLRAWVLTIAQNVALDTLRRARPTSELVDA